MSQPHVAIIGAGMGGLASAVDLASRGARVSVFERGRGPGGKMRQVAIDGAGIDAGPTVFTMRWIFEALFERAGARLAERLDLVPADILARHGWLDGSRLDLFADIDASAQAIETFSDRENAEGYRQFCARSKEIYAALKDSFIAAQRPHVATLMSRMGLGKVPVMLRTSPTQTLWRALGQHFTDPRLRQLFGRYATYIGSSPMRTPATLMLVAHVEQDGVWLVRGGMIEVARAMQALAEEHGAQFHFEQHVDDLRIERGKAVGLALGDGTCIDTDAIVFNGDTHALASGRLGAGARRAVPATPRPERSLSAITWCTRAVPQGFDLVHHNVFFGDDYEDEFNAVFRRRDITSTPTVYLCAQDRGEDVDAPPTGPERMLLLVNAPADGDQRAFGREFVADIDRRAQDVMRRCGLSLDHTSREATTPAGFNELFPATGGALYGRATHGAFATFSRASARTRIPGLFVAGGSAHPGPGIPMATMSGRLAADAVAKALDLAAAAQLA